MPATKTEPPAIVFNDDGLVPNNPLPFLVYKNAVSLAKAHPEETIEKLFAANGWGGTWRNGVYDFLHYHATERRAFVSLDPRVMPAHVFHVRRLVRSERTFEYYL